MIRSPTFHEAFFVIYKSFVALSSVPRHTRGVFLVLSASSAAVTHPVRSKTVDADFGMDMALYSSSFCEREQNIGTSPTFIFS